MFYLEKIKTKMDIMKIKKILLLIITVLFFIWSHDFTRADWINGTIYNETFQNYNYINQTSSSAWININTNREWVKLKLTNLIVTDEYFDNQTNNSIASGWSVSTGQIKVSDVYKYGNLGHSAHIYSSVGELYPRKAFDNYPSDNFSIEFYIFMVQQENVIMELDVGDILRKSYNRFGAVANYHYYETKSSPITKYVNYSTWYHVKLNFTNGGESVFYNNNLIGTSGDLKVSPPGVTDGIAFNPQACGIGNNDGIYIDNLLIYNGSNLTYYSNSTLKSKLLNFSTEINQINLKYYGNIPINTNVSCYVKSNVTGENWKLAQNNSYIIINTTTGAHYFCNLTTTDFSISPSITNILVTTLKADILSPTIILSSPLNNTFSNQRNITFISKVDDDSDIANCSLWDNETGTFSLRFMNRTPIQKNVLFNISKNYTNDGYYIWNIKCCDIARNCSFNATNRSLVIDTHPPSFLNNITNTTPKINEYIQLNITINDSNPDSYRFSWNSSGIMTNDSAVSISSLVLSTVKQATIAHAYYCWQYWANDSAGNINVSNTFCFTVNNSQPTTPIITKPANNSYYNDISINFCSTDNDNDTLYYFIFINDTLNVTSTVNITNWTGADGYYKLKISTYDNYSYSANTTEIIFVKDTVAPNVSLISPTNATTDSDGRINFTFNFTDTFPGSYVNLTNCSLFINNALNQTLTNLTINTIHNFTINGFVTGTYSWLVECTDQSSNKANSTQGILYVNIPVPSTPTTYSGGGGGGGSIRVAEETVEEDTEEQEISSSITKKQEKKEAEESEHLEESQQQEEISHSSQEQEVPLVTGAATEEAGLLSVVPLEMSWITLCVFVIIIIIVIIQAEHGRIRNFNKRISILAKEKIDVSKRNKKRNEK